MSHIWVLLLRFLLVRSCMSKFVTLDCLIDSGYALSSLLNGTAYITPRILQHWSLLRFQSWLLIGARSPPFLHGAGSKIE